MTNTRSSAGPAGGPKGDCAKARAKNPSLLAVTVSPETEPRRKLVRFIVSP